METPEAVRAALMENRRLPFGTQRTVTAEAIADAAEQFDDPVLRADALLQLMTAYEYGGEHRKSPVAFARVLKVEEEAPGGLGAERTHSILWRFKWVTTSLIEVPEVPLDAIRGWTGRMAERYRAAGHGMQPVAAMRHKVAFHTGVGEREAFELWVTRPREELSDCEACETRQVARHHLREGDDAAALAVWEPVLTGRLTCAEEPAVSAAHALLPLLRLGRADEARAHHLAAYREVRGRAGSLAEVGLHLEFCALSGNEPRGLEILADSRALFEVTGSPLARLGFLTGAEVLLRRLDAAGHAALAVPGPAGREWTAGELLAHVAGEAERLAAAFDARNGTGAVGERRRARLAAEPVGAEPLTLGVRVTRPVAAPPPAAPVVRPEAEDLASLVARARRLDEEGRPDAEAVWDRVAALVAAGEPGPDEALGPKELLSAELAAHRGHQAHAAGRAAETDAELARAADLFEAAGDPGRALVERARALACRAARDPGSVDEEMAAALDALAARAAELPGIAPGSAVGRSYLTVLHCRMIAAGRAVLAGLPEPAPGLREWYDAALAAVREEGARLEFPHRVAGARRYVAELAAAQGRLDEAAAEMEACVAEMEACGRPWNTPPDRGFLAQLRLGQGRPADAVDLLHQALAGAVRYDDRHFPFGPTYRLLGAACAAAGDPASAVRHLAEAADRLDRAGQVDAAAEARLHLADVLAESGQQAEAVAVLESAAGADAPEGLDERIAAQVALTLARRLGDVGEHRAAAEEYLRLADVLASWEEDRHLHTMVAAEAACALTRAGRDDAARTAYERAVASHAGAPHPGAVLAMMREFALLAPQEDGTERALAHLAEADALLAALPEGTDLVALWFERGCVDRDRARVLARAGRSEEALAAAEAAVAAFAAGEGPQAEASRAESSRLAALVEADQLGRPREALARLAEAKSRCEAAGLTDAAAVLDRLSRRIADTSQEAPGDR